MPALDRRAFLLRAIALAGAATGLGGLRLPVAAATTGATLSARRHATCRALLGGLGRSRHRDAAAGARRFAAFYAQQSADMRAHADAVLDAAAAVLPRAGGHRAMRARPGGAAPSQAEAHRRAVLLAAVTLIEGSELPERSAIEGLA